MGKKTRRRVQFRIGCDELKGEGVRVVEVKIVTGETVFGMRELWGELKGDIRLRIRLFPQGRLYRASDLVS